MLKKVDPVSFIVNEAKEGGYYAEAIGVGIFAEGNTLAELKKILKAVLNVTTRALPMLH